MKGNKSPVAMIATMATIVLMNGCIVVTPEIRALSLDLAAGPHARVKITLGSDDRTAINHYYQARHHAKAKKRKGLPPGLAKKKRLPPGLQRQLERNGQLPPGLQGKRLPKELERQLAPLPKGYVRLLVGSDVVIINEQSRVIVDLMVGISL